MPRRGAANDMQLGTLPKRIMPKLLDILEDSDDDVRDRIAATETLQRILRIEEPDEGFAKELLPALIKLGNSSDIELASEALRTIGYLGEHGGSTIPLLVSFAEKEESPQRSSDGQTMVSRQLSAVLALGLLGPVAKDAIPALERLDKNTSYRQVAGYARRALKSIRGEQIGN